MNHPNISDTISDLRNFCLHPLENIAEIPIGKFYDHEKQAEQLIDLAASFVDSFIDVGGDEELHKRFILFLNITTSGSMYSHLQKAAYQRLRQSFEQAATNGELQIPTFDQPESFKLLDNLAGSSVGNKEDTYICVAQISDWDKPERFEKYFITQSKLEHYLGSEESILWYPYELKHYCGNLMEFLNHKELLLLYHELLRLFERINESHLWGCFLLITAHSVIRSSSPDASKFRNLLSTIHFSHNAITAIKKAAEDLWMFIQGNAETLRPEQKNILQAMMEMDATHEDKRKTAADIIGRALGVTEADAYKPMMADLSKRHLIETKEGRGGGGWLTSLGKSVAKKLSEEDD